MNKIDAMTKVLSVAKAQVGYCELPDNHTKYATEFDYDNRLYGFDMDGYPWCDYFFDWLFCVAFGYDNAKKMTYQYDGCQGASCAMSANYYQNHGAYFQYPEIGDQIFFYVSGGINHTGIIEDIQGNTIITIEGNSSDSVRRNSYQRGNSTIAGYGRPDWSVVADVTAEQIDAKTDEDKLTEQSVIPPVVLYMTTKLPIIKPNVAKTHYDCVETLQTILNGKGYSLAVDGYYGQESQNAVQAWQLKKKLDPDKEVGAKTWLSLITEK